jgi:hypothetical protein
MDLHCLLFTRFICSASFRLSTASSVQTSFFRSPYRLSPQSSHLQEEFFSCHYWLITKTTLGDLVVIMAPRGRSGNGGRDVPKIRVPTPGQDVGETSPEEISGEAPDPLEMADMTHAIMSSTQHDYPYPDVKPMGFRNGEAPEYPTQVCYRNAAITLLMNLPYFTNWLVNGYPLDGFGGHCDIVDAFHQLATDYWTQADSADDVEVEKKAQAAKQRLLDKRIQQLWEIFLITNPRFTRGDQNNHWQQEDAGLFLMTLLESAFEELEGPLK